MKLLKILIQKKNLELTKLNEEFKFVTDFMPQMVWVTDPEGNHIFYNEGWYEYTGTTFEQTKDEGWNNILHPDDQERAWEVWRHSLSTGEPYEIEYRFRKHDGERDHSERLCGRSDYVYKKWKILPDVVGGRLDERHV